MLVRLEGIEGGYALGGWVLPVCSAILNQVKITFPTDAVI